MSQANCTLEIIKAAEGDCFFLSFTYENRIFNMMIDSGPGKCWNNELHTFLDNINATGKRINVLLITHIDADHIGGALKLFSEDKYCNMVDEVWYNGLPQITNIIDSTAFEDDEHAFSRIKSMHYYSADEPNGPISVRQAQALSTLLRNKHIPVNTPANGSSITSFTPSVRLSDYFQIDFLLPKAAKLQDLKTKFQVELYKVCSRETFSTTPNAELAFEYTMLDECQLSETVIPISQSSPNLNCLQEWATSECCADMSKTNASSIAICFNFYGKKLLFLGDANSEDICDALMTWSTDYEQDLFFDVVKLPHHGASGNNLDMLNIADARYFILSTDGERFSHPSKETVAKIVSRPTAMTRQLVFNYKNRIYDLFSDESAQKQYDYAVHLYDGPIEI